MLTYQRGKRFVVALAGALDEGLFGVGHGVSRELDSEKEEKFQE
jgi:hypothetical protein